MEDGTNSNRVLHLREVRKIYVMGDTEVRALDGVDLDVQKGEFLAIMGPSGSGKSTLLNLLGCLDRPSSGQYWVGQRDVAEMNDNELSEIRSTEIGFIFQSFNLIPSLTVLENVEVPMFYAGRNPRASRQRAKELIASVGLGDRFGHRPTELSGGQQQRVAIARALANDPRVILADEPTGNLDTRTGEEIMSMLRQLSAEGRTIIMVTHEEEVAAEAERQIMVRDGRIHSDSGRAA